MRRVAARQLCAKRVAGSGGSRRSKPNWRMTYVGRLLLFALNRQYWDEATVEVRGHQQTMPFSLIAAVGSTSEPEAARR